MGNCSSCVKGRPQPDPIKEIEISEDEIVVLDNRDGYFAKGDMVEIMKKYPEYKAWEQLSRETMLESKPKPRRIKWKEGEVIGHGSFGRVVLGLNLNTGEIMAVKQVYFGEISSDIIQSRIQALEIELDLLSHFSHKNIVRYIGTSRSKTTFSIFLEYISGGTIASLVKKYGPFNEQLVKLYTKQILEGLEYLHARNIIHRDIKGANVLVDNSGVCKLADFGSAKKIYTLLEGSMVHSLKGTANWMAPEVVIQKGLSRFSDIWSIGCVIIEMLTGQPPWSGANQMATMFQIAKAKTPPQFPPNISSDCADFLDLCFKVNSKERANVTTLLRHKFLKDVDQISQEIALPGQVKGLHPRIPMNKIKSLGSIKINMNKNQEGTSQSSVDENKAHNPDVVRVYRPTKADSSSSSRGYSESAKHRSRKFSDSQDGDLGTGRNIVSPKNLIENSPLTNQSPKRLKDKIITVEIKSKENSPRKGKITDEKDRPLLDDSASKGESSIFSRKDEYDLKPTRNPPIKRMGSQKGKVPGEEESKVEIIEQLHSNLRKSGQTNSKHFSSLEKPNIAQGFLINDDEEEPAHRSENRKKSMVGKNNENGYQEQRNFAHDITHEDFENFQQMNLENEFFMGMGASQIDISPKKGKKKPQTTHIESVDISLL